MMKVCIECLYISYLFADKKKHIHKFIFYDLKFEEENIISELDENVQVEYCSLINNLQYSRPWSSQHILEWLCRLFLYNLLSCLYFRLLFVYNLKSGTFWLLNNQGPIVLTHAQNFWVLTCTHTTYLFILWEFLIVYLCLYYLSPAAAPITIWIKMLVIYLFLDEKEKNNKNQHQFLLRHFYQKLHLQETQTMQVFVNITIWI